ncbi:MAG: Wzz/FepE/Etk N-terminal domain-containing protein [Pseudomonadota bacterium]
MDDGMDILGYAKALKRRWWLVAICIVFGSAAAVAVALFLPPVYQSSAKILVESQQIPDELARSTVTSSASERLELIKQRLMTRDNLLEVIERLRLFQQRDDLTPTQKVDMVRASAQIQNLGPGGRRGQRTVNAFEIRYKDTNPEVAARVANEFVTIVLQQNLETRSQRATETHSFFREEVSRLAGALLALEAEIASYKNRNEASLPENLTFRHTELSGLEERILNREQELIELRQQRSELREAQKDGRSDQIAERQLTQEERDLAELRRALLQKEAVFAPTHPEIRGLKARIAALETAVIGEPSDGEVTTDVAPSRASLIDQQIALIDNRVTLFVTQIDEWRARQSELAESISATPKVEMSLNAFDRRYKDLQTQYALAVRKQAEAATGEKLEVNRQSERFEIIEQARVSEEPIAPPRKKIALAGVGGSVALGVGLVILIEMLFGSIHTTADLERKLQIRTLGAIPYIRTREDKMRTVFRWVTMLAVAGAAAAAALWLVDQHYLPLTVIIERAAEKLDPETLWTMIKTRLL